MISLPECAMERFPTVLPHDSGGVIAVDTQGNVAMEFNTPGMFRGMCSSDGNAFVGIWKETIDFRLL